MDRQNSFADIEYSQRRRKTKREEFLEMMNEVVSWRAWVESQCGWPGKRVYPRFCVNSKEQKKEQNIYWGG